MERLHINSSSALLSIPLPLLPSLSCLIKRNFLGTALTEVDGKSWVSAPCDAIPVLSWEKKGIGLVQDAEVTKSNASQRKCSHVPRPHTCQSEALQDNMVVLCSTGHPTDGQTLPTDGSLVSFQALGIISQGRLSDLRVCK